MSLAAHHQNLLFSSSSSSWPPVKPIRAYLLDGKIVVLDHLIFNRCYTRKRGRVKLSHVENVRFSLNCRLLDLRKKSIRSHKSRRIDHLLPSASADDGVTVNGSPQARTSNDIEEMRVFELAIKEHSSLSKTSWFSPAWLGVDKNAWDKAISYQASLYSLLQAANEISSRGDVMPGMVDKKRIIWS